MTVQAGAAAAPSMGYRYLVVWILAVVYTLSYLDRQIVAILAEPIRRELQLTDTQLGILGGIAFAAFYATFGLPVAWLADRTHRVRVIAISCGLWSLFTVLCGTASSFVHLAFYRMGVGIGEAGGSPPSYSLISDYFPPEKRGTALALYSLGVPMGAVIGAFAGGRIAEAFGWRAAFYSMGVPGIIMAVVLVLVVREPKRGSLDALAPGAIEHEPSPPLFSAIGAFFRQRTLVLVAISSALSSFVGNGALSWNPTFLMRIKGMTLGEVSTYYALVIGVCGVIGVFAGGWLVDRAGRRDRRWFAWVPAIAFAIASPSAFGIVTAPTWQTALAVIAAPSLLTGTFLAPAITVVQNSVSPNRRTLSGAMLLFISSLIGLGFGPVYVGRVADWAKPEYGDRSLAVGLVAMVPIVILTVAAHLAVAWSIGRDMKRARLPAAALSGGPVATPQTLRPGG